MTSIGDSLGRYRLVERLGEGGVGVVYRAQDARLERDVAIKVLSEHALADERALRRFRQEARALSRLVHPNIATLFDFDSADGVDFLVLEFVAGETLASTLAHGPLPEGRARAIGIEVAEALSEAHEHGIVHRDLKPLNIVITPRGRAKVLDFGLAHLAAEPDKSRLTENTGGLLVGTIHYMAPEQILGETVDPRTDIYALGVMLFEMTTGAWPYPGGDLGARLFQIVQRAPSPLREFRGGLSRDLEEIVTKCLDKDPGRRFASAAMLAEALREAPTESRAEPSESVSRRVMSGTAISSSALSDPIPRRIDAIAVLPLENRSGDPDQEFFADGMTDALIAGLAQIGALRVISRTSSMRFKGTRLSMADIARDLKVDALVEGSVMRSRDRVRITVQLIEATSDASVWAHSYEGDISDVLTLQREVARSIADGVRVQITPEEATRLAEKKAVDPGAFVAYLRGRYMWNRWDTASLHESIRCFNEALAKDPAYALAWAGLADSYGVLGQTGAMPPGEAYPKARAAALEGLAIDDDVAELHASLGYVHRFHDWDWPAAERSFLRALSLNPGYATARRWYAQFVSAMGRHEEAVAEAQRALELDPLSLIIHTAVGDALFYARRFEESVEYYRKSLAMDPTFVPGHTDLARSLEHLGRPDEALAEFIQGVRRPDGTTPPSPGLATMLLRAGRRDDAASMIGELITQSGKHYVSPYAIASYFAVAGDTSAALDWLERAHRERDGSLVWIKVHPRLDGLRQEQRFRELLTKMRLD